MGILLDSHDSKAWASLLRSIKEALEAALKEKNVDIDVENEIAEGAAGDISSTAAFKAAKILKKSPVAIADELARTIKPIKYIKEIKAEKGFINFYIERDGFASAAIDERVNRENGSKIGKGEKVIIEYPSVNPNKPWHVGHLRNALIGDSVSNIYSYCNYIVEREDYIDDMGSQIVETLWMLLNSSMKPDKKYDHWLGEVYVKANEFMQKDPGIKSQLSELLKKMEGNSTNEAKKAREMCEKCVIAQYETAFSYSIYHDVQIWESDIIAAKIFEKAMELLKEKKIATYAKEGKYENCLVMDFASIENLPKEFSGMKEQNKVLVRSNGTATYAAKDIAFHMWKFGLIGDPFQYKKFIEHNSNAIYATCSNGESIKFGNVSKAINIIDMQQHYEQSIVRLALMHIGCKGELVHLAYNTVELGAHGAANAPEKEDANAESNGSNEADAMNAGSIKLSGRKGTWKGYTADELLEEARKRAKALITGRFKGNEEEKAHIADAVALAAIKFEFLRMSPEHKIIFSWDSALNFDGISGPYCQYMHARASKIIANMETGRKVEGIVLSNESEFGLVKAVAKVDYIIEKACRENRPSVIADYAGKLAVEFSRFYESCPVLKAEGIEKESRMQLVYAFAKAMKALLGLLGIEALESM